jgi:hypothetical protein
VFRPYSVDLTLHRCGLITCSWVGRPISRLQVEASVVLVGRPVGTRRVGSQSEAAL